MNKSLLGSLDSPSGWDVPLFCQNQIAECYNFPLVWFTWKISTYSSGTRPTGTHAPTHAHVCSPSELLTFSSRLIAIDICLLSWACSRVGADGNGWCYCLRRKGEGRKREARGEGGGVRWKEENQGRQAPHAAPRIHLDPLFARKVTGRLNLTSSLQKSRCCGHPWGTIRLSALSHNLSFSLTVYCHHGRDIQYVVLDRPPETSW